MATEAELILKLTDQTQAGFKAIQDSLKGLQEQSRRTADETKRVGDGISGMGQKLAGWAAGFLTVRAASDLLVSSLKAQGEQEASINKLNLALANQGNLTQATSTALQEYADHLQATTTFSDDAVLSAQAMLASFGMNEEQIKRTTKAAADFSAATGKDLQATTELLGKAFAGNTAALSRYGIVVDENIPKSEKFGAALEQLEQRFQGSAEAATTTFGGGLAQLQNALGEVQEGIGKAVGELLRTDQAFGIATEAANRFAQFLKTDLVLAISEARAQFAELFAGFLDLMAKIGEKFKSFTDAIGVNAGKLGLVLRATTGLDPNLDSGKLKQMAEDQRKFAQEVREAGNQAATSAGKTQQYSNQLVTLSKVNKDATKSEQEKVKAMAAAMKAAAADQEKFFSEQERLASKNAEKLLGDVQKRKESEEAMMKAVMEHAEKVGEHEARALRTTIDWKSALQDVAHQFQAMGGAGGFVAQIAGGITGIATQIQRLKTSVAEGGLAGAGGIGGMLGKLASGIGIAGAAFSIGKAIFGGIKKLFGGGDDSKKAEAEAKRAEEAAKKAAEAQRMRIEGLSKATSGLTLMATSFHTMMERAGAATAGSQAQFSRLGNFAVATFAGLVRETGDVIGALQQMGPSLDSLQQSMGEFGLTATGAFAELLSLQQVVVANEDVANSISGLNQLMKGLGDAGLVTKNILMDLGAQASSNFDELINRGVPANQAMALMQPTLQELWERQKQLGVTYDENTEKLLRQAEEQGLVGTTFLDTNEQILEVLKLVAETLGATLPDALRRMGDAAESEFARFGDAAHNAGNAVPGDFPSGGSGGVPGFANEGFIPAHPPFGRHIRVSEREGEFVLKESTLRSLIGSGGGGSGDIFLDGRKVGKRIQRREEIGDKAVKNPLRRAG